jgi:hypothetical protein
LVIYETEEEKQCRTKHRKNEELDAVEAFKTCHTSSKHGLTELAREAVVSHDIYFAVPTNIH